MSQGKPPGAALRPIDPEADRAVLLRFARDLFATSFADADWFPRRFGATGDGYLAWLREVTRGQARFASLLLVEGDPAGMVVLGPEPDRADTGHVYHYYLTPVARGGGLGRVLDDHATATLTGAGFATARLHVAPDNAAAIRFYRRQGWHEAGPVAGRPVIAMALRQPSFVTRP